MVGATSKLDNPPVFKEVLPPDLLGRLLASRKDLDPKEGCPPGALQELQQQTLHVLLPSVCAVSDA